MLLKSLMEAYLPACLLGRKVVRAFVQRETLFTSSSVHRTGAHPAGRWPCGEPESILWGAHTSTLASR